MQKLSLIMCIRGENIFSLRVLFFFSFFDLIIVYFDKHSRSMFLSCQILHLCFLIFLDNLALPKKQMPSNRRKHIFYSCFIVKNFYLNSWERRKMSFYFLSFTFSFLFCLVFADLKNKKKRCFSKCQFFSSARMKRKLNG